MFTKILNRQKFRSNAAKFEMMNIHHQPKRCFPKLINKFWFIFKKIKTLISISHYVAGSFSLLPSSSPLLRGAILFSIWRNRNVEMGQHLLEII